MLNFDFFKKVLGINSPLHFVYDFLRKNFPLYSVNWPNFIALIAFSSCDIGQCVYCNCLLTRLERRKF